MGKVSREMIDKMKCVEANYVELRSKGVTYLLNCPFASLAQQLHTIDLSHNPIQIITNDSFWYLEPNKY